MKSLKSEFANIKRKNNENETTLNYFHVLVNKLLFKEKKRLAELNELLNFKEKKRLAELNELLNFTQVIINKKGQFHFSAEKLNRIEKTDRKAKRLIEILKTEVKDIPEWMCGPVYRDAILFYDKKDNIIQQLNICLSCDTMVSELSNEISADSKTYQLIREFLIEIGHEIDLD